VRIVFIGLTFLSSKSNIFKKKTLLSKMSTEVLQVKKITENAYLPVRGTPYAAGTIEI